MGRDRGARRMPRCGSHDDRVSRSGRPHPPSHRAPDRLLRWDRRDGRPVMTDRVRPGTRSEEHTSELQSLMRISYAVFCLKKKKLNQYLRTLILTKIRLLQQVLIVRYVHTEESPEITK